MDIGVPEECAFGGDVRLNGWCLAPGQFFRFEDWIEAEAVELALHSGMARRPDGARKGLARRASHVARRAFWIKYLDVRKPLSRRIVNCPAKSWLLPVGLLTDTNCAWLLDFPGSRHVRHFLPYSHKDMDSVRDLVKP